MMIMIKKFMKNWRFEILARDVH